MITFKVSGHRLIGGRLTQGRHRPRCPSKEVSYRLSRRRCIKPLFVMNCLSENGSHSEEDSEGGRDRYDQGLSSLMSSMEFLGCYGEAHGCRFGDGFERELGEELLEQVKALPGTHDVFDYMQRTISLAQWQRALQKGILPNDDVISWPAEPFRSKFADTIRNLEMLNFTRRYPKLLDSLLRQMMELVHKFEAEMLEMENKNASKSPPKNPLQPSQQEAPNSQQNGQSGEDNNQQDGPLDGSMVRASIPTSKLFSKFGAAPSSVHPTLLILAIDLCNSSMDAFIPLALSLCH